MIEMDRNHYNTQESNSSSSIGFNNSAELDEEEREDEEDGRKNYDFSQTVRPALVSVSFQMASIYDGLKLLSCTILLISSICFCVLPSTWFLSLLQAFSIIFSVSLLVYHAFYIFHLDTKYAYYFPAIVNEKNRCSPVIRDSAMIMDELEAEKRQLELSEVESKANLFGITWNIISCGIVFFSNAILLLLICITTQPTKRKHIFWVGHRLPWPSMLS